MSVSEQDIQEGRINDDLSSQLESISARVEANVENGRNAWADFRADASERCNQALSAVSGFARERPWQIVGVAAAIGLIAGLACRRR